ncbi:MAG: hypothetical protein PHX83_07095 [Acidobacteriia bacterium]|nr:hypothetical protein [Terriglobia bacterium]
MNSHWQSERDAVLLSRIRLCMARGLSRRGAARTVGIGLPKVNALLDLNEETEDTKRREPCAKRKRCIECGAPAVDVLYRHMDDGSVIKRPLCRKHMCPDPTPRQREAELWYHISRSLGSNLGQAQGSGHNDSVSLSAFLKLLNAAMQKHGLNPDTPTAALFGSAATGR